MSRHRSGSKKAPPEIGLHMECVEEDLEQCQIVHYNKAETEYNEIQNKLDDYVNKMKAEVIEKGENCLVLQLNVSAAGALGSSSQAPSVTSTGKGTRQTGQNYQQVVGQGILTRSSTNTTGNTYLVMDPRLGLVVGQVPPTTAPTENTISPSKSATSTRTRTAAGPVMVTTRARSGIKKPGSGSEPELLASPSTRTRDKGKGTQVQPPTSPPTPQIIQQVYSPGSTAPNPGSYRIKVNAKQLPPPAKPAENNALGGLTAGSKTPWKPSSDDGAKGNVPDSREVTFNKMSGKTFPSLVVAARPNLRLKYIPQSNITQERTGLDAKVKGVLMYTPTKFTEWLIQQGLIRSEQFCQFHVNNDLSPVKLKLGMYSDVSKFPYSGGYVWISECCPSQFVSVFSGSIFEGAPHPPTTLLKLIYHWACQTNVQNVVQWVKVDNLYVKNFFTNMRAVCTQAIHQKHQKLGGPGSKIEVGVISLGTTSQDGNVRQVKVEVLGVMDPESKFIRLRALEPFSEERYLKRRFAKILEPLEEWVHKESTIFTDFTVDKGTLINMGFRTVYQISASDTLTKYSNQNVMEYLRRVMPRMFQNTLSLLSRQIIQQFLDELVWREVWGPVPSQAFVNIIAHISEQTKLDVTDSLLFRLNKVASNPFKNWYYSVWKPVTASLNNTKAQQPVADLDTVPLVTRLQSSLDVTESGAVKNSRNRKRTADSVTVDNVNASPAKKAAKVTAKDKTKKDEKTKALDKITKKDKDKETPEEDKSLTEEIIAFINNGTTQIPLDSYYYGTRQGDEEIIASERKGNFQARCSVCNVRFEDNIILMKHMILHAQLKPFLTINMNAVHMCDHCFTGFNSEAELKEHKDEAHIVPLGKVDGAFNCQICEERFKDRVELIYHMHRTHVEMELPYECGVCFFRTSVYKTLIDHFMQIHKGGEYVLCPFCLKVVAFSYKKKCLAGNIRFFESHLEKHGRTALTKKCHRCKLSFIHKGIFDQHMEADHCSFKSEIGVKPFAAGLECVLMPEPGGVIKPIAPPKDLKTARTKPMYATNRFNTLEITDIRDDTACIECEGSLLNTDHFSANFNCLKCRYATCCEAAVNEHVTIFHESTVPQFTLGKPINLVNGMFCICGYSSYSGNKIAKHIAICEKNSAYPSEEAANAVLASREKYELKSPQSGDGQNMLNMLGLVRKSPENGGTTHESLNKAEEVESLDEDDIKQENVNDQVKEDIYVTCKYESSTGMENREKSSELDTEGVCSKQNNEPFSDAIDNQLESDSIELKDMGNKDIEVDVKNEGMSDAENCCSTRVEIDGTDKLGEVSGKFVKKEEEVDADDKSGQLMETANVNFVSIDEPSDKDGSVVERHDIEMDIDEVKLEDEKNEESISDMALEETEQSIIGDTSDSKTQDFEVLESHSESNKLEFEEGVVDKKVIVDPSVDYQSNAERLEKFVGEASKNVELSTALNGEGVTSETKQCIASSPKSEQVAN